MQIEAAAKDEEKRSRKEQNPWDRVCNNCDFTSNYSAGGKDLTRMKQAMLARKGDHFDTASKATGN